MDHAMTGFSDVVRKQRALTKPRLVEIVDDSGEPITKWLVDQIPTTLEWEADRNCFAQGWRYNHGHVRPFDDWVPIQFEPGDILRFTVRP